MSLKTAFNKIVIFSILILLINVHVKSVWFLCVCVCLPQSLSAGIFKHCLDRSFWWGLFLNTLFRDSCGMKYAYNVSLHWCIESPISFPFSFLLKFDIVSCHLLKSFIICRSFLVEFFLDLCSYNTILSAYIRISAIGARGQKMGLAILPG